MYVPSHFAVRDEVKLKRFLAENPFATLVSSGSARLLASHIPILLENAEGAPAKLIGHLARANPQAEQLQDGSEVLTIFHGPHAYISPFCYEAGEAVPTWNYATVHVYGTPSIVHDRERSREIVDTLTAYFEKARAAELQARWSPEYKNRMLNGIVAFEIQVQRIEGKFKLGQNRSPADQSGSYEALRQADNPSARALAALMEEEGLIRRRAAAEPETTKGL